MALQKPGFSYIVKKICSFLFLFTDCKLFASPIPHITFGSPAPNLGPGTEQVLNKCLLNDKMNERNEVVGLCIPCRTSFFLQVFGIMAHVL